MYTFMCAMSQQIVKSKNYFILFSWHEKKFWNFTNLAREIYNRLLKFVNFHDQFMIFIPLRQARWIIRHELNHSTASSASWLVGKLQDDWEQVCLWPQDCAKKCLLSRTALWHWHLKDLQQNHFEKEQGTEERISWGLQEEVGCVGVGCPAKNA